MNFVAGVRFREVGKIKYFEFKPNSLEVGDIVIASTQRGVESGKIITIKNNFQAQDENFPDEKIIRKATPEDLNSLELKKKEEKKAGEICSKKIKEHGLKMHLIETELMFDRRKVLFYFVAESRIDFRNLVKDLSYIFRKRIELRQVGLRDEAKIVRGVGICGKQFCCGTFLKDFHLVTAKMARDQNMSMNPSKLAGCCGKLLCCIKYEEDAYLELLSKLPGVGDDANTQEGTGIVMGVNVISNAVRVNLNSSPETNIPKFFDAKDIKIIKKAENKFTEENLEIELDVMKLSSE